MKREHVVGPLEATQTAQEVDHLLGQRQRALAAVLRPRRWQAPDPSPRSTSLHRISATSLRRAPVSSRTVTSCLTGYPSLTVAPNMAPDFSFAPPLATVAATTVLLSKRVLLPSLPFYCLIQNNLAVTMSTGATTAPFLQCAPYTESY